MMILAEQAALAGRLTEGARSTRHISLPRVTEILTALCLQMSKVHSRELSLRSYNEKRVERSLTPDGSRLVRMSALYDDLSAG